MTIDSCFSSLLDLLKRAVLLFEATISKSDSMTSCAFLLFAQKRSIQRCYNASCYRKNTETCLIETGFDALERRGVIASMPSIRFFDANEPVAQYPPIFEDPSFTQVVRNFRLSDTFPLLLCTAGGYGAMLLFTRNWRGSTLLDDLKKDCLCSLECLTEPMTPRLTLTALTLGPLAGFIKGYSMSHCTLTLSY